MMPEPDLKLSSKERNKEGSTDGAETWTWTVGGVQRRQADPERKLILFLPRCSRRTDVGTTGS